MSIFQKSIVKKHISSENPEVLKAKWNLFTSYFHNATIQENIHNSKEEQFQEGFLRELFVKVLGYTLNPEPNFNLTTEYKNIKDSKKADGAIIINNTVTAVIELKGTATTDLGKVESQAFNYKNNQHQCLYVITSNFEKLRFYIDNAIEHIEFNLFKLTEEEFQLLYLCLAFKNIENNVPKNIKDESVSQEDVITKKLYNNYSLFKRELHHNLVALNPGNDPLELFQKSQKLLDRFLFIFFAEDRGLLPTNLIFRINKEWQQLREMRIEVSLYDRYKIYFSDLNVGAKVSLPAFSQTASNKKEEFQIYAYNGGLFKEDDELNTLKIDDELLFKHTEKLSNYDFASEVDVNILGHIFENSLNELDEIKAQIEGQEIDKTKTKRKKDGVFYTPKYITKYIVDNTVGKLCTDKKFEFKILEEEYITDKKRNKTTIQNLAAKLSDYRNWLLQITICDPACGSGAFLNQALDFLINEHQYIDELQAKLFGDAIVMSDVEQSILEHNIFGVDINEESVEIAKLSLWLRTAQPNRKLNDLNNNIKCGNSLIDDVAVAGDKAFNWKNEFKEVFENGGFDVIVGNPPWNSKISPTTSNEISKKFQIDLKNLNMFAVFFYLGNLIINKGGIINLLIPEVIIKNSTYLDLRNLIINKYNLISITDYGQFPGVASNTVSVCYQNAIPSGKTTIHIYKDGKDESKIIDTDIYNQNPIKAFSFDINLTKQLLVNKISNNLKLAELSNLKRGIELGQVTELIKCEKCQKHTELSTKYYSSREANKCKYCNNFLDISLKFSISSREQTKLYNRKCLSGREVNRYSINEYYYIPSDLLGVDFKDDIYSDCNLFVKRIATKPEATLIKEKCYSFNTLYSIYNLKNIEKKVLLLLINSKLLSYYYDLVFNLGMSLTTQVTVEFLKLLPIRIPREQNSFIEMADLMLTLNEGIKELVLKFQRSIHRKFEIADLPKKLQDYYLFSYSDFIKELAKKKVKLSLAEEAEWEDYFNSEAKKALELKSQIDATDKEIDQLVYKLYDLTEEEIAIVEKV